MVETDTMFEVEWEGWERCPRCGALKDEKKPMCTNLGCEYTEDNYGN